MLIMIKIALFDMSFLLMPFSHFLGWAVPLFSYGLMITHQNAFGNSGVKKPQRFPSGAGLILLLGSASFRARAVLDTKRNYIGVGQGLNLLRLLDEFVLRLPERDSQPLRLMAVVHGHSLE